MQAQAGQSQGQMMQGSQGLQTPPRVISGKDLDYLTDQMSWLHGAIKKFHHYAKECTDPQVRQFIQQACQTHQKQYDLLLKHCQNQAQSANAGMGLQ